MSERMSDERLSELRGYAGSEGSDPTDYIGADYRDLLAEIDRLRALAEEPHRVERFLDGDEWQIDSSPHSLEWCRGVSRGMGYRRIVRIRDGQVVM